MYISVYCISCHAVLPKTRWRKIQTSFKIGGTVCMVCLSIPIIYIGIYCMYVHNDLL